MATSSALHLPDIDSDLAAETAARVAADAGAVILAPASSARNVIQPTAGAVIAEIIKAHAAQSVDLAQWQKSDGSTLFRVTKDGYPASRGLTAGFVSGFLFLDDGASEGLALRFQNAIDDPSFQANEFFLGDMTISPEQGFVIYYTNESGEAYDKSLQFLTDGGGHTPQVGGKFSIFGGNGVTYGAGKGSASTLAALWAALKEWGWLDSGSTAPAAGAPSTATYITQTADAGLSSEQALSALATGLVKNTTGTGVLSIGAAGTDYYAPGSTDVAVADGGTGSSTAAGARTNLGAAPLAATYIVQTADSELSGEQALGALATGLVKNTTTTGVLSIGAQGTDYYAPGGTDVAVADGGTGASTAAAARTNLGIATFYPQYAPRAYVANRVYGPPGWRAGGVAGLTLNRMHFIPLAISETHTFIRIGVEVTTGGSAGSVLRFGLYDDTGANGPGALILDGGTVATTGTGAKTVVISQSLAPGRVWIAVVGQVAAPTLRFLDAQAFGSSGAVDYDGSMQAAIQDTVTGALPNPAVPTFAAVGMPSVGLTA